MASCAKRTKSGEARKIKNRLKKAQKVLQVGLETVARYAYMWFHGGKYCHKTVREALAKYHSGEYHWWFKKYLIGEHYMLDARPVTG